MYIYAYILGPRDRASGARASGTKVLYKLTSEKQHLCCCVFHIFSQFDYSSWIRSGDAVRNPITIKRSMIILFHFVAFSWKMNVQYWRTLANVADFCAPSQVRQTLQLL